MFRNYINIAFRNLWKNKAFSMINIIGLSLGLSASFVIVAMIYYDLTFDKFHEDGDRIYRATSEFIQPEGNFYNHGVSIPLGEALRESVSGVETVSTFFNTYFLKAQNKDSDKTYRNIDDIIFADKNYFELFKYNWLAGTPDGAFENPNEVVLTESRAAKYFPDLSPM
jgi:hypothetical protein